MDTFTEGFRGMLTFRVRVVGSLISTSPPRTIGRVKIFFLNGVIQILISDLDSARKTGLETCAQGFLTTLIFFSKKWVRCESARDFGIANFFFFTDFSIHPKYQQVMWSFELGLLTKN